MDVREYDSDQPDIPHENGESDNPSGAYIFKPTYKRQRSIRYANLFKSFYYKGDIVSECHLILTGPITGAKVSVRGRALRD